MRLYEHEAKDIFKVNGVPVLSYIVVRTPEEAEKIVHGMTGQVIMKANVLVGGRAKAGGIKYADTPEEARQIASELLGAKIRGFPVESVLIEEKVNVDKELYASITIEESTGNLILIVSSEGGIDIEKVAEEHPERVHLEKLDLLNGLNKGKARILADKVGLDNDLSEKFSEILLNLYRVFVKYDALLVEINPLAILEDGRIVALDAVLEIDDNSLYRHPDLKEINQRRSHDDREQIAQSYGFSYVALGGNIGVMGGGAGLTLATCDQINLCGEKPANFLDCSANLTTAEMAKKALELILGISNIKGIIVNLYGGINNPLEVAKAIVELLEEKKLSVPLVFKGLGNFERETWELLEKAKDRFKEAKIEIIRTASTREAAQKIVNLIRKER